MKSVQRLIMGWTVRGSNPGKGEVFRTRPDRPWGPPSLLYNGYRVPFPGVKRPERGVNHPPPSSAEVNERVELYLYSLFGLSWPVLGGTLPFTLLVLCSKNPSLCFTTHQAIMYSKVEICHGAFLTSIPGGGKWSASSRFPFAPTGKGPQ